MKSLQKSISAPIRQLILHIVMIKDKLTDLWGADFYKTTLWAFPVRLSLYPPLPSEEGWFKGLKLWYLKAKARLWPWLSYTFHFCSTADECFYDMAHFVRPYIGCIFSKNRTFIHGLWSICSVHTFARTSHIIWPTGVRQLDRGTSLIRNSPPSRPP